MATRATGLGSAESRHRQKCDGLCAPRHQRGQDAAQDHRHDHGPRHRGPDPGRRADSADPENSQYMDLSKADLDWVTRRNHSHRLSQQPGEAVWADPPNAQRTSTDNRQECLLTEALVGAAKVALRVVRGFPNLRIKAQLHLGTGRATMRPLPVSAINSVSSATNMPVGRFRLSSPRPPSFG